MAVAENKKIYRMMLQVIVGKTDEEFFIITEIVFIVVAGGDAAPAAPKVGKPDS